MDTKTYRKFNREVRLEMKLRHRFNRRALREQEG